ncbi:MAG: hypothetical protein ACLPPF_23205 [Rhodomicrobium sp.]
MPNSSPAVYAIDSIAQCLATAAEAVCVLDVVASRDLRSLLQIAACEVERVRKATRKAAAPKKVAAKAGKKPAKREAKAVPLQTKSRRKAAATVNGAAAH